MDAPERMKINSVLLIDADGDCEEPVSAAAVQIGHRAQWVRTSQEAFAILTADLQRLALVIVDVDPGSHGLALLEAISACADRPPVVVIAALEEAYMKSIAEEHGAAACLGKPLAVEKLKSTMTHALAHRSLTCDRWGCLIPQRVHNRLGVKAACAGIATKLSPIIPAKEKGRRSR
jgi:DNA-binding NtrC family response regulator